MSGVVAALVLGAGVTLYTWMSSPSSESSNEKKESSSENRSTSEKVSSITNTSDSNPTTSSVIPDRKIEDASNKSVNTAAADLNAVAKVGGRRSKITDCP